MRRGVVILEDETVLLSCWDDNWFHNVVFVSFSVERALDDNSISPSAVPNTGPHHYAATSVSVMLKKTARSKPLSGHPMNSHPSVMEV